jgi:hypothetical protein
MEREREELRHRRSLVAERTAYERQRQQYQQVRMQPQQSIGGSLFGQSFFYGQVAPKKTVRKKRKKVRYQYVRVRA